MTTRGTGPVSTTPHVPAALWAKADGDPKVLARLVALHEKNQQAFIKAAQHGEPPGLEPEPEKPSLRAVRSHPSVPRVKGPASRGPWVLSIEGLGRPLTFNAERTSAMSPGTTFKVRAAERTWSEAVADAAVQAGVPVLARAFTVIQPYYPTNVVPDVDALPASCKAAHDGLVRAGVLPDDRRTQLPFGYHVLPPITDGQDVRLTVTVFPLP